PTAGVRRRVPAEVRGARPGRPPARRASTARAGKARLVARRRRFMLGLLGLAFLTFVLAVSGVLSWWWQMVVDLAVAAYVVHLRSEVRRARAFARAHPHARPAQSAPPVRAEQVETVDVPVRTTAETSVAGPLAIHEET